MLLLRGGGAASAGRASARPLTTTAATCQAQRTRRRSAVAATACAAAAAAPTRSPPQQRRPHRHRTLLVRAIHIDRRAALERSWQRQQRAADLELADPPRGGTLDVGSLRHLEAVLDRAADSGRLVVALFYSRSCGSCRRARQALEALALDAESSRTRSAFCCVDVHDEYDHVSPAARLYGVRAVPSFAFFVGGALVRRLSLRDVRALAHGRSPQQIRAALEEDVAGVRRAYRAMVLQTAPSAGGRDVAAAAAAGPGVGDDGGRSGGGGGDAGGANGAGGEQPSPPDSGGGGGGVGSA